MPTSPYDSSQIPQPTFHCLKVLNRDTEDQQLTAIESQKTPRPKRDPIKFAHPDFRMRRLQPSQFPNPQEAQNPQSGQFLGGRRQNRPALVSKRPITTSVLVGRQELLVLLGLVDAVEDEELGEIAELGIILGSPLAADVVFGAEIVLLGHDDLALAGVFLVVDLGKPAAGLLVPDLAKGRVVHVGCVGLRDPFGAAAVDRRRFGPAQHVLDGLVAEHPPVGQRRKRLARTRVLGHRLVGVVDEPPALVTATVREFDESSGSRYVTWGQLG